MPASLLMAMLLAHATCPSTHPGFKFQAQILSQMCHIVDAGLIGLPLFNPAQVSDPNMTNQQFVREYLMQLLQNAFQNLQPYVESGWSVIDDADVIALFTDLSPLFLRLTPTSSQVKLFVSGLFELNKDMNAYKQHLRDFLIQLKEFAGDDNSELFLEERETEIEQKRRAEMEAAMRIPGMLKPAELDDMED